MVGRTRNRVTGLKPFKIGRWVPDGSFVTISNPRRSVCYDRTNPGPPYKSGGSLLISDREWKHSPSSSLSLENDLWGKYQGSFIHGEIANFRYGLWGGGAPPGPEDSNFGDHAGGAFITSNMDDLDAQGATGFNRAKPGKPIVDLGQFLGELPNIPTIPGRGLLNALKSSPKDAKDRVSFAKAAGNEYLNVEFGWKPILSDLQKILFLKDHLATRIAQLKRDNGKPIRRQVTLVNIEDSDVTEYDTENPFYPYVHPFYHVNGTGKASSVVTSTRKDWFVGKFRYYIPDINMPEFPSRITPAFLGLNPSPSLVWELTPWSWLIDYFANVGDVLSNMSDNAAENLVAEYGYIMSAVEHTTYSTQKGTINTSSPKGLQSISASITYRHSLKRRSFASPYGFGLKPGDLSGRQAAILGALGISRVF